MSKKKTLRNSLMFLVRMKKNSQLRHMGNLDGKDVCFWMLAKRSQQRCRRSRLLLCTREPYWLLKQRVIPFHCLEI